MRKIILICFMLLLIPHIACAEPVMEQFDSLNASEFLDVDYNGIFTLDSREVAENLITGQGFDIKRIFKSIIDFVFREFKGNLKLCVMIITLGIMLGIISNMQSAFGGKGASECGFLVGYCIFSGVLSTAFLSIIEPAREMTENVSVMITSTIPILISMLTLSGGVATSALLSQGLILLVNVINTVIDGIIIPLIMCGFALSVCANMSDKINMTHLLGTINKAIKWILLFMMAIFAGVFGIYGLSGSAIDASAGKAVRFAIGSGIPLVGGIAADSIDTVIATFSATRSIIGTVGICAILVVSLVPILRTAVMMWIFRLCCALIEPFSSPKTVKLLSDTAESIMLVFAVLISVCLLFISAIGVLLIAGNFVVR